MRVAVRRLLKVSPEQEAARASRRSPKGGLFTGRRAAREVVRLRRQGAAAAGSVAGPAPGTAMRGDASHAEQVPAARLPVERTMGDSDVQD